MDSSEYNKGINDAQSKASGLGSKLKSGLGTAGSLAAKGLGLVAAAAGTVGGALLALEASTEEYRIAQGKLNTAFEAAGMSAQAAETAYNGFYAILGDTDTATEASQLLAKLAQSEQDLTTWTDIAAGVYGTFGDALPIEGLIEAANETAKVGTVTGTLADALNWAGISEDEFNAQLAACGSEAERNQLIMETLSGTYDEASEAFYRNNEALVQAREAQAQMDASLAQLGTQVTNVKNKLIGEFLPSLSQVTQGLAMMLQGMSGGSQVFSAGITNLVNTFITSLPQFLNFGVQIVTAIAQGLVQSLPAIATAGGQLLLQIGNGIVTYLPQLVAQLPVIITGIVDFLTANFPTILQKGTELLIQLATGIIQAIPQLVSQLPQIITSFVNFIASALPQIVQSGIQILLSLASGIIQSIPQLVAQLPAIMSAIANGILSAIGTIITVGRNIVEGLWQGIQGAAGWLLEKVKGFFTGILDKAKGFLGIASPSKVFRDEVGKMIGLGVAEGIDSSSSKALKAAEEMAKKVYESNKDWVEKNAELNEWSLSEQLEVWQDIQSQFIKSSKQYADAEKEITDLKVKIREEYAKKVEDIQKEINDLEQNYADELASRTQEIFNSYGLFDAAKEKEAISGNLLIDNLASQVDRMEEFYTSLAKLSERGVSAGIIEEFRTMGVKSINELDALLNLSDEKLSEFSSLYEEKQALANEAAVNELKGLREETDKQILENINDLKQTYKENAPALGTSFTDGLSEGILGGMSTVINAAVRVATAAIKATQSALGIASPSKVFKQIGSFMVQGLSEGWEGEYSSLKKSITSGMDFNTARVGFERSGLGISSAGIINSLPSQSSGGIYTFNLVLPDGTKIATYMFNPLINYARANGTPILNPVRR